MSQIPSTPLDDNGNYMSYSRSIDLGQDGGMPSNLQSPSATSSQYDQQSGGHGMTSNHQRAVVRAACLNCRSAKRRCDGVAPVCGPCFSRGIEAGGCNFVSSKRGGPRYKGVKGSEATKAKADKDRAREVARASRGRRQEYENGRSSVGHPSDAGSMTSQRSASPQQHYATDSRASYSSSGWQR